MPTFDLIDSFIVTNSSTTTITFAAIPQTYTDLLFKVSVRNANANYGGFVFYPNSSSSNLAYCQGFASNSTRAGQTGTNNDMSNFPISGDAPSNTFTAVEIYVPNYKQASKFKTFQVRNYGRLKTGSDWKIAINNAWQAQASAITSFQISGITDNLAQNSTVYMYGISNA